LPQKGQEDTFPAMDMDQATKPNKSTKPNHLRQFSWNKNMKSRNIVVSNYDKYIISQKQTKIINDGKTKQCNNATTTYRVQIKKRNHLLQLWDCRPSQHSSCRVKFDTQTTIYVVVQ